MSEVQFTTAHGLTVHGEWVAPVDNRKRAVLFSHGFLRDRHHDGWFDLFAKTYRSQGWATLQIDHCGSGFSDDAPLTLENQVEDLYSALFWLKEQGMTQILLHGHGIGSVACLQVTSPLVVGSVLGSPVFGPIEIAWERVFSDEQLQQLETHGFTRIPDDLHPQRDWFTISKETLSDLTLIKTADLVPLLNKPTLLVADQETLAAQWFDPIVKTPRSLLPEDCQLLVYPQLSFDDLPSAQENEPIEALRQQIGEWSTRTYD